MAITLYPHKTRVITFYSHDDKNVPVCLNENVEEKIEFTPAFPLPFAKKDITKVRNYGDVYWLASDKGLARYCESEKEFYDKVMYFSADRDMKDNKILALCGGEDEIWVKTETCVSHIELKMMSMEEKADMLLDETLTIVERLGMVSQRRLDEGWNKASAQPYACSDNDGGFTAMYCMGLIFRYAVFKREKGADHEDTIRARATAIRSLEACLLLMFISGRGNGFVARTFLTPDEPVPDDGLFYRIENGKATCLPTTDSKRKRLNGYEIPAVYCVPERLRHLYEDEGHTIDGVVYKGDTSSDEITPHYMLMYFAHLILGEEDPEFDEIIKASAKNTLRHIIANGYRLMECFGKPTTWGRWDKKHFRFGIGWADAPLKTAEILMYHKVTMAITGEKGEWEESYNRLIRENNYAELSTLHEKRLKVLSAICHREPVEGMMYGDHIVAAGAFWLLITLEEDEKLKDIYRKGLRGWNGTLRREHNPIYDFMFMLSCPDDEIDTKALSDWFRRQNVSNLAASVNVTNREDVKIVKRLSGKKETSKLLMPDERSITKYDRNPYDFLDEDVSDGTKMIESCYVYTTAYWLGRYYGFIEDEA